MSSGSDVERLPGETHYERFLREVELSKQHRRKLGLRFWRDFPDDPRRYSWLIYAVNLAPVYPADITAWARAEGRFDYPYPEATSQFYFADTPRDAAAIAEWEAIYPELRAAFMASPDVTIEQKRVLRHGELRQRAWDIKRAALYGEPLDDDINFAQTLLEHYRADPAAYEYWSARALTLELCHNLASFDLDEAGFLDFAAELRTVSEQLEEFVDDALLGDHCSETVRQRTIDASPDEQAFWIANSMNIPDHAPIPEGDFIFFHIRGEAERRRRAMIGHVWEVVAPRRKKALLYNTTSYTRFYARFIDGLVNDVQLFQTERALPTRFATDEAALEEWLATRARLLSDFVDDPEVPRQYVAEILGYDLRKAVHRHLAGSHLGEDLEDFRPVLEEIHALYAEYGEDSIPEVYRALRSLLNQDDDLAIDPTYLQDYLARFEHPWIVELVAGRENRHDLRNVPIELAGPTLSGGHVDVTDLRGKIVLLKFWSTSCSSCIAAMPKVQEIYDEYRDRGFEVVAVSSDAEERGKRVQRIVARSGSTWPTIVGDTLYDELNVRFGVGGAVPQYMLFNREGLLVADTGELDLGRNLRTLLDAMLAEEVAATQAEAG